MWRQPARFPKTSLTGSALFALRLRPNRFDFALLFHLLHLSPGIASPLDTFLIGLAVGGWVEISASLGLGLSSSTLKPLRSEPGSDRMPVTRQGDLDVWNARL